VTSPEADVRAMLVAYVVLILGGVSYALALGLMQR
jgi:hypothetical protein